MAEEVGSRVYHELLFARYMPEILGIETGGIKPASTEEFKRQLRYRISR